MADYQNRLDRLISVTQQRMGLNNLIPGTKAYQLLQSVAYEQTQVELVMEKDATNNSLFNSTGSSLKSIGEDFFGIEKRVSKITAITDTMLSLKFYVKNGTFGSINNGSNIVIPIGVTIEGIMPDGTLVRLATTTQTTLDKSDSESYVSAELIQGPTDVIPINTLTKHYFTNYAQSAVATLYVTNSNIVATGRPDETDDNYRYRLTNGLRSFAKTNTAGIFDLAIDVVGVSYIEVDPSHNGGGTFAVYVQSINPITSDSLIDEVYNTIAGLVPPWVEYKVLKPNYIGLRMDITVTMSNPSTYIGDEGFITTIQNVISNTVNNYLEDTFYPLDILRVVSNINADIVSVTFNSIEQFLGVEKFRYPIPIDTTLFNGSPITLSKYEKLVIEPISNAITIRVA